MLSKSVAFLSLLLLLLLFSGLSFSVSHFLSKRISRDKRRENDGEEELNRQLLHSYSFRSLFSCSAQLYSNRT